MEDPEEKQKRYQREYRNKNDEIYEYQKEYNKEYKEKNKDKINENQRENYHKNKKKVCSLTCICGGKYQLRTKERHKNSKIHQYFITEGFRHVEKTKISYSDFLSKCRQASPETRLYIPAVYRY